MSTLIDTSIRYALTAGVVALAFAVLIRVLVYLRDRIANRTRRTDGKRGRVAVWTTTMTASTLLATVIVLTQIGFYEKNLGDNTPVEGLPWLNLAYITPVAVEVVAWVFTVMVSFAVINGLSSAPFERLMWLASSISAGVNAWHNIHRGDWLTGVVLGLMSIAVPLMVHYALRWDRNVQAGLSAEQIRAVLIARLRRTAQVVRHPANSWKAMSYATDLGCSWEAAYRLALTNQYDAVHAVLVDQIRRSMPTVQEVAVEDRRGRIRRALFSAPKPRMEVVHDSIESAQSDVHDESSDGSTAVHTDPLIADLTLLHDPRAFFERLREPDAVHEDRARSEARENSRAQDDVHEDVHDANEPGLQDRAQRAQQPKEESVHDAQPDVQGPARPTAEQSARLSAQPKKQRAQQSENDRAEVVRAHSERQEHVAARHWWQCKNAGTDPRARTNAEVARELGINPSAVSRGFKWAEGGFDPDKEA